MSPKVMRCLAVAGMLCFLLGGLGCGKRKGTVSGNVTYGNKPVVWGTVSIIASDDIQYSGQITPQGTYSIPNVPNGPVRILVSSPNPNGAQRGGAAAERAARGSAVDGAPNQVVPVASDWFEIPERFADPEKSSLTGTVNSNTIINLNLE